MGTVTLGVSLAVPEPYGSLLQQRRAGFGDPAAHGIPTHITLLPPTETDPAARPAIETHLARVAAAGRGFRLRLSGTDTFRPVSPVVFVRLAEGAGACARLQERVRAPEGPLGRELQFPYHPHVTVAHGIAEEAMDRAQAELADFEASWTATGFALYEQGPDLVWRLRRRFFFGEGEGEGVAEDGGAALAAPVPRQAAVGPSPTGPNGTAPAPPGPAAKPAPAPQPFGTCGGDADDAVTFAPLR